MDPLSISASIIAVLQLTNTVVSYLAEVRDASKEQKRVAIDASNLYGLLTSLRYRVESAKSTNDPWYNQVRRFAIAGGPLDQLKHGLEELIECAGLLKQPRKRDKFVTSLTWHWKGSQVDVLLEQIERLKTDINLALNNDLFSLAENIREGVDKNSSELVRLAASAKKETVRSKILGWLISSDPSTNYDAALWNRQSGTGLWLLENQTFLEWRSSKSPSTLWLYGDVGCGKTVLCSTLLQHLLESETQPKTQRILVWYFYFDFKDLTKQYCQDLLKSLFKQLAHQSEDLTAFEAIYSITCSNGASQPSGHVVKSILRDAVQQSDKTFLILDALDECAEIASLLDLLQEIQSWQKCTIAATSRSKQELKEFFMSSPCYKIKLKDSLIKIDIEAYIQHQTSLYARKKKWSTATQEDVASTLIKGSDGMFQWVVCQLDALSKCLTIASLKKALKSLPPTLDETYTRIFHNIESAGHINEATTALQWLCYSFRPLYPTELLDALVIQTGEDGGFDLERRLGDPEDLTIVCSNFIYHPGYSVVNDDGQSQGAEEDVSTDFDTLPIRLSHFSVQEYLLSPRCALKASFETKFCHAIIGESCLRYLLNYIDLDLSGEDISHLPLISYAKRFWFQHLRKIESLPATTRQMAFKLLTITEYLLAWVHLCGRGLMWLREHSWLADYRLEASELLHPLIYASMTGLPDLVETILQNEICCNLQEDELQSALIHAARSGSVETVKFLLDAGAKVDSAVVDLGSALSVAALYGMIDVVRHLLDAGANADKSSKGMMVYSASALASAASGGQEEIVQLLLNVGVTFETRSKALGYAIDNPKSLQMIIEYGVNIDERANGSTPLQLAIFYNVVASVWILLENNADVNASRGGWGTALETAILRGNEHVVQALLDAGANYDKTNLNRAIENLIRSREGDTGRIATILLKVGANPNFKSEPYGSWLQQAAAYNLYDMAKVLIASGADPKVMGGRYGNVLQAASVDNDPCLDMRVSSARAIKASRSRALFRLVFRQKTVRLCVEYQADGSILFHNDQEVDDLSGVCRVLGLPFLAVFDEKQKSMRERTIRGLVEQLEEALEYSGPKKVYSNFKSVSTELYWSEPLERKGSCPETVLQTLLDFGARFVYTSPCGRPSLDPTPASIDLVQILLESGAVVDSSGGLYGKAIQAASRNGSNDIVDLLLKHGAQPNGCEGVFGSPLQAACATFSQNIKLVQTLIDAGALVNAVGGLFGTALQAACHRGHQEVVQLLLDSGADVSIESGRYGTALQAACASPTCRVDIIEMLMSAGADVEVQGGIFGNAKQAILINVIGLESLRPPRDWCDSTKEDHNPRSSETDSSEAGNASKNESAGDDWETASSEPESDSEDSQR